MRPSRWVLLLVTLALGGGALVALGPVADDDGGSTTTTEVERERRRRPRRQGTTTTGPAAPTTAPPVTVPGAVPAEGALLDQPPGDLASFEGCQSETCVRARGSGGAFVVEAVEAADGTRTVHLYREEGGAPVARTPDFPPGVEVFGISVVAVSVDGEPVVVVDYDHNGSGNVHSFDVVAWDAAAPAPRVVAFVGGSGQDHLSQREGRLEFVSANYDDGAPTCCPTRADVRRLSHPGPGDWVIATETVPIAEAP